MTKHRSDNKLEGVDSVMRPIGRLPNRCFGSSKQLSINNPLTSKANRYLAIQSDRITEKLMTGNISSAVLIWCMLAKNSKAYQTFLFNKVNPHWYWKQTESEVHRDLLLAMNKFRSWNLRTFMNRYYLLKKNGKYRPIGAPDLPSKMLTRFLSDMTTCLCEETRSGLPVTNHAYRPNKGRHTAVLELIERWFTVFFTTKKYPLVKEFDFKAYFNNVPWQSIKMSLIRFSLGSLLPNIIYMYLKNIRTRIPEDFKEESELIKVGVHKSNRPIVARKGMPQGSPVSPVLATLACDLSSPPVGLTMYADDGIYIGESLKEFDSWLSEGEKSGRYVEHSKTKVLKPTDSVKFCGYMINFTAGVITNEQGDSTSIFQEKDALLAFLKKGSHYNPQEKKRWEWDVNLNSYAVRHRFTLLELWRIVLPIMFFGVFKLEYKGFKWIPFKGIYSVSSTSSECVANLLSEVKRIKNLSELKRIKPLRFDYSEYPVISEKPKNVRTHFEYNPEFLNEEVRGIFPQMSMIEMMLSTRSFLGTTSYVKYNIRDFRKKLAERNK